MEERGERIREDSPSLSLSSSNSHRLFAAILVLLAEGEDIDGGETAGGAVVGRSSVGCVDCDCCISLSGSGGGGDGCCASVAAEMAGPRRGRRRRLTAGATVAFNDVRMGQDMEIS